MAVNIASAWLLSGAGHGHDHGHSHGHRRGHDHHEEMQRIVTSKGVFELSIFEEGVPPVFRFSTEGSGPLLSPIDVTVTTIREDGSR